MDETRFKRNELSRNKADQHQQLWSEAELEILVEFYRDPSITLEQLAEELGRTVEACRQRFYEYERGQAASEKVKQVTQWTKGFTSLEDMGF